MLAFSLFPTILVYVVTQLRHIEDTKSVYTRIVEIEAEINCKIALEVDALLLLMVGLYPCLAGTYTTFLIIEGLRINELPFFANVLIG